MSKSKRFERMMQVAQLLLKLETDKAITVIAPTMVVAKVIEALYFRWDKEAEDG